MDEAEIRFLMRSQSSSHYGSRNIPIQDTVEFNVSRLRETLREKEQVVVHTDDILERDISAVVAESEEQPCLEEFNRAP